MGHCPGLTRKKTVKPLIPDFFFCAGVMYSGECTHMYIVTVQIYSCARDLIRLLLETFSGFIFYGQSGHREIWRHGANF
jgi:hypothetical protein